MPEIRSRLCPEQTPFRLPVIGPGDIVTVFWTTLRLPVEALQKPFILFHLHQRITVIFRRIKVEHPLDFAAFKNSCQHLGIGFVDSGKHIFLLDEKQRLHASERIETAQLPLRVEIGHHFGRLDLVEMFPVFLDCDESIGHKTGPIHRIVPDYHIDTVCGILPGALLPYHRVEVETGERIQVAVIQ